VSLPFFEPTGARNSRTNDADTSDDQIAISYQRARRALKVMN
jgi:hypothetical protein